MVSYFPIIDYTIEGIDGFALNDFFSRTCLLTDPLFSKHCFGGNILRLIIIFCGITQ